MEKVTILGSANAVAKSDQQNTHLLFETSSRKILVDCGDHASASLARAGVELNQVTDLILTHFHADHVGSLPLVIMDMWLEKRTAPLTIYGLEVTLDKAKKLLDIFDWQKWTNMFPVDFVSIGESGYPKMIMDAEVEVTALPVLHLIPTIGLRFQFNSGRIITYSCDTEPCGALDTLADKADILLQEAAGPGKGHTSPEQAGEIASRCGVKQLVLIHYEARNGKQALLSGAQAKFSGSIIVAEDGMVL
ncbi:MAG: MBL fold metallo-hydrolase [Anaerolineaceae bacterium]|nr:MBL fold metallo-hydrolase [Anaerolineaceae bacterium]